jgi:hypothetical protein
MWGFMAVGTDCCDKLTEGEEASEILTRLNNRNVRLKRFISSKQWTLYDGGLRINYKKWDPIYIYQSGRKYRMDIQEVLGRIEYDDEMAAKVRAFDFFDTGEAFSFFAKRASALEREEPVLASIG